jgi:hypothetical protein
VNVARAGTDPLTQLAAYDLHLFPIDVQAKLCSYYFFGTVPQCSDIVPRYYDRGGLAPREEVLISHLKYRKGHPDEPPLVALSAIPKVTITPSPEPTAPSLPVLTPDAIQVERWKEYQTELAKRFVSVQPSEVVLCEWEILGRDKYELYVWAVCVGLGYEAIRPAVIHLEADGSIQNVETPLHGSEWDSDLQRMFPEDV